MCEHIPTGWLVRQDRNRESERRRQTIQSAATGIAVLAKTFVVLWWSVAVSAVAIRIARYIGVF